MTRRQKIFVFHRLTNKRFYLYKDSRLLYVYPLRLQVLARTSKRKCHNWIETTFYMACPFLVRADAQIWMDVIGRMYRPFYLSLIGERKEPCPNEFFW